MDGPKNSTSQPAAFFDRDGVLVEDVGYGYKPSDLKIRPTVPETLERLQKAGYALVIITNQSGVARGYFSEADVDRFHEVMIAEIQKSAPNVSFDAIKVCPHHPEGTVVEYTKTCDCRKPGTKLVDEACREIGIDRERSLFFGDKESDMECARAAGVTAVRVAKEDKLLDLAHSRLLL